ncbi:Scd6-like Sm domain-containing protein [Mycotypha africana]|uniref:Scd6-like Sm domain-containing protein n=1 Tax=Mycotypha africana TaxID=64632 RepID=UPI002301CC8F|nr:Scd6-like Sm domain-containing protein [Mycotypha africana]KAI8991656.1 Scd6-like Sm domain-containing protein [Mycotypha africana]
MAGENYIGSKISLISLSDIRYVGILHSINAQDSTVGLKQVRSYGTEGRRGKPEEEILPSDNVFDYVVFRGKDIKDLQVFEPPPPPPAQPPTLPQDPAIMSMSGYPPMNPYMNNPPMYMQPPQPPSQQQPPSATGLPGSQPAAAATTTPVGNAGLNNQNYWQPPTTGFGMEQQQSSFDNLGSNDNNKMPEAKISAGGDKDNAAVAEKDPLDELKAELEASDALQPNSINEAAIERLAKKVSEMGSNDDFVVSNELLNNNALSNDNANNVVSKGEKTSLATSDEDQQYQQQQHRQHQNRRQQFNQYYNNNSNQQNQRNNNYHRRYNNNNNQMKKTELVIPNSEFDFEAANAKFDKNEVIKKDILGDVGETNEAQAATSEDQPEHDDKEGDIEIPKPDDFYDKSSSFFDNISCESKERSEQQQQQQQEQEGAIPQRRSRYHEERKLNMETFGQATVDNSRYRHNNYNRTNNRGGYRPNNNRGGYNRQYNNRNNNNSYGYNNNRRGFQQQQQNQIQQQSDAL